MPSVPNELRVVSLCSYLTGELKARSIDWPAIKMVKALKGDPIKGYFELSVDGVTHRFDQQNVRKFLDVVPRAMASAILQRINGAATLVPIPNSHVVAPDTPNFSTFTLANGIAAASGGRLKAAAALVFIEPQEKARKGGPRGAGHLFGAYQVIGEIEGPVVLVDDVWTLGGHLKAACWKLESPQRSTILACTVAHTTHEHIDKPVGVQEHTIDLSRPFFDM
jgi:hypothetical protein